MLSSLAEFKKEGALKKERAFPCTSFRKKKLLNSKRESTRCRRQLKERLRVLREFLIRVDEVRRPLPDHLGWIRQCCAHRVTPLSQLAGLGMDYWPPVPASKNRSSSPSTNWSASSQRNTKVFILSHRKLKV